MINGDADAADQFHHGVREGPNPHPLENGDEEAVILIREAFLFVFFHRKGFHNPISSDRLMEEGGDRPHPLLALAAEFPEPLAELCDGDNGDGKDEEGQRVPASSYGRIRHRSGRRW